MADGFNLIASRHAKQAAEQFNKIAQNESIRLADAIRMSEFPPTDFEELQVELPDEYSILLSDLPEESDMMQLAKDLEDQNAVTNPDLSTIDVPPSIDVRQREEMIDAIASVERDNRTLLERTNKLQEKNNEYQVRIEELTEKVHNLQGTNNSLLETQNQLTRSQRRRDRIGLVLKLIGVLSPVTGALAVTPIPFWIGLLFTLLLMGVLFWQDDVLDRFLS